MKRIPPPDKKIQEPPKEPPDSPAVANETSEESTNEIERKICAVTCTTRPRIGRKVLDQIAKARIWPSSEDPTDAIYRGFASMEEMAPQSPLEARLSVQMMAANDAALMFLNRSVAEGQSIDMVNANVGHATRLMRLFLQQIEAWQKLKSKTLQVNVDQVHVYEGGQAIVGSVNTSGEAQKQP